MRIIFFLMVFGIFGVMSKGISSEEMEQAWKNLNSENAGARSVAREAIEAQPIGEWLDRALLEHRSWAALEAIQAVCNKLPASKAARIKPHLCEMMTTLSLEHMSEEQLMDAVKTTKTIFEKLGAPTVDERRQMIDVWKAIRGGKSVPEKARVSIGQLLEWLKADK